VAVEVGATAASLQRGKRRCPLGFRRSPAYFFFTVSFTVVFGFLRTVDCRTNRPVEAERPRLPPPPLFEAFALIVDTSVGHSLMIGGSTRPRPCKPQIGRRRTVLRVEDGTAARRQRLHSPR
jgi:hypothetical protein